MNATYCADCRHDEWLHGLGGLALDERCSWGIVAHWPYTGSDDPNYVSRTSCSCEAFRRPA